MSFKKVSREEMEAAIAELVGGCDINGREVSVESLGWFSEEKLEEMAKALGCKASHFKIDASDACESCGTGTKIIFNGNRIKSKPLKTTWKLYVATLEGQIKGSGA